MRMQISSLQIIEVSWVDLSDTPRVNPILNIEFSLAQIGLLSLLVHDKGWPGLMCLCMLRRPHISEPQNRV